VQTLAPIGLAPEAKIVVMEKKNKKKTNYFGAIVNFHITL
jgi:hypothetical protein